MDKNFNDQELSDIMKEIEALEDDFKTQEKEFVAGSPLMEELAQMDEASSVRVMKVVASEPEPEVESYVEPEPVVSHVADPAPVHHHVAQEKPVAQKPVHFAAPSHSHGSSPQTAMSFKVTGDIKLDLHFDIGGTAVQLCVNESGLSVQMEGGMTFCVPLNQSAKKKAA